MKIDVLIAGAGPVGLTMAMELARYGRSVRIVDKNQHRTDKSKAIVVWPRTLELLDRVGPDITERFIQVGLKATSTNMLSGDQQIAHIDLSTLDSPYKFVLLIQQSETERLLEEQLEKFGVRVERQVELQGFEQSADAVTCKLQHADGRQETVEADWLVGCDGAHSTVRHTLGKSFEGSTLLNDWILADLHITGIEGPPAISIHWHADGVLALFPLEDTRYRVIADVGSSSSSAIGEHQAPTLAQVQQILTTRGPKGLVGSDPVWLSNFTINERKVADYRTGRVFLAGDAAHVHSPAGGQGMNTGMHDAFNLAWKLSLVSRGLSDAELLLTSYNAERGAVARLVLQATGRATMVTLVKGKAKQAIRNFVASHILGLAPVRHIMADALSEISVGYPESPLNSDSGSTISQPKPGKRAPINEGETPVGSGSTPRFALFAAASDPNKAILSEFPEILEQNLRAPFDPRGLWLVRPDGYVALSGHPGDADSVRQYLGQFSS
jgi:2-polyprenyl-6-methoxyphenol hydroxylase-like FAD-dependent oxidoreductase